MTTETLEHVIFCDAQDTTHAAVDRTLTLEWREKLHGSALSTAEAQRRSEDRDAAFAELREVALHGVGARAQDARNVLVLLGWDGS